MPLAPPLVAFSDWSRRRGALLLLAATFVVTVLLAERAIRSTHEAKASADRMLRHIADLTAWELAERSRADLTTAIQISTWLTRRIAEPAASAVRHQLPPADSLFNTSADLRCTTCPPRLRGQSFAVFRLNTDVAAVMSLSGSDWTTADTVLLRSMSAELSRPIDSSLVTSLADSVGPQLVPRSFAGANPPLLLVSTARDGRGRAVAVYAMVVAAAGTDSIFRRVLRRSTLLPASVTRGIRTDSLVRVALFARRTGAIFRSEANGPLSRHHAEQPVGGLASDLFASATLTERGVRELGDLAPGAQSSGQPYLLLALSVALLLAVGWQIRRREALDRARTDFIASVSHELQAPLTLVTAYVDTMLLGRTRDADEQKRFLGLVLRETARLSRLVDNILRFSAPGVDITAADFESVDLYTLTEEACREFEPVMAGRDMRIAVHGERPVPIMGDREGLRRMVLNLLDNAAKYGPTGQRVDVRVTTNGNGGELIVDDAGPGIRVADRQRAFQRFVRLGSAVNGDGPAGSGLGLAIVRDVVDAHGGSVTLEDAHDGRGLRVRVRFGGRP